MTKVKFSQIIHYILSLILSFLLFTLLVKLADTNIGSYYGKKYIYLLFLVSSIIIVYVIGLIIKKNKFLRNKTYPLINIFVLPLFLFFIITQLNLTLNIFKIMVLIIWIVSSYLYITNINNSFDLDYKKKLIYPDNLIWVETNFLAMYYFILLFNLIDFAWASVLFAIFFIYFDLYLKAKSFKIRLDGNRILAAFLAASVVLVDLFRYFSKPLLAFNICFIAFTLVYYYRSSIRSK